MARTVAVRRHCRREAEPETTTAAARARRSCPTPARVRAGEADGTAAGRRSSAAAGRGAASAPSGASSSTARSPAAARARQRQPGQSPCCIGGRTTPSLYLSDHYRRTVARRKSRARDLVAAGAARPRRRATTLAATLVSQRSPATRRPSMRLKVSPTSLRVTSAPPVTSTLASGSLSRHAAGHQHDASDRQVDTRRAPRHRLHQPPPSSGPTAATPPKSDQAPTVARSAGLTSGWRGCPRGRAAPTLQRRAPPPARAGASPKTEALANQPTRVEDALFCPKGRRARGDCCAAGERQRGRHHHCRAAKLGLKSRPMAEAPPDRGRRRGEGRPMAASTQRPRAPP